MRCVPESEQRSSLTQSMTSMRYILREQGEKLLHDNHTFLAWIKMVMIFVGSWFIKNQRS